MESKIRASSKSVFVNFEPPCDWHKDDGSETLVLYLPEFIKEQLRIQICNMKTLKISGQRHVDEVKFSRFCKTLTLPRDCNAKEIRAKFIDGSLQIKMPKKNSSSDPKQEENPKIIEEAKLACTKSKPDISQDQANKLPNSSTEEDSGAKKLDIPSNVTNVLASKNDRIISFSRFKRFCKVAFTVLAVSAVVAGFGTVIVYSCMFLLA